tara:strand:+ start:196 stop:1719 length:1524 start_codon:yes stop_codon:yes gene_type:complete
MTTKKDNFKLRRQKLGSGLEESLGVPQEGFQDPTGEFPKREYNFGSSINHAARGIKINNLYTSGGDIGVSLNIADQRPSEFPFNQVDETTSGHVVEYDDTPGGERILIKHRTGAGVEMRADGSVIVSSTNNRIEVTGGDQTTIVEGAGNLVYKGNLNLVVTGDYNVDVGGNYNVQVAGNMIEGISENHRTFVTKNSEYVTKGTKSTKTIGNHTDIMLADNHQYVKGNQNNWVQGDIEIATEQDMFVSAKSSLAMTSEVFNATGVKQVSIFGMKGSIGGKQVDFTGQVFQGNEGPAPFTSGAAFYGSFHGQATEAMFSRTAWTAEKSKFAEKSDVANAAFKANTAASGAAASVSETDIPTGGAPEIVLNQEIKTPIGPPPIPSIVAAYGSMGDFAIRDVAIDEGDKLKNRLDLSDDYKGIFDKHPTTQEIRSRLRGIRKLGFLAQRGPRGDVSNLLGQLIAEGRVSDTAYRTTPDKIGRTVGKEPSSRFGYTAIGNAIDNRGKRFTPK